MMNVNNQGRRSASASKNQPARLNIWDWLFGGAAWG